MDSRATNPEIQESHLLQCLKTLVCMKKKDKTAVFVIIATNAWTSLRPKVSLKVYIHRHLNVELYSAIFQKVTNILKTLLTELRISLKN